MNMLISALKSPLTLLRWLFKHRPVITLIELSTRSAVHAFFIMPIVLFFNGEGYLITGPSIGFGVFLGFLSIVIASHQINNNADFEVNNYDVLALSLRDYLTSRGMGILITYIFIGGLGFMIYLLAIPVSVAYLFYDLVVK